MWNWIPWGLVFVLCAALIIQALVFEYRRNDPKRFFHVHIIVMAMKQVFSAVCNHRDRLLDRFVTEGISQYEIANSSQGKIWIEITQDRAFQIFSENTDTGESSNMMIESKVNLFQVVSFAVKTLWLPVGDAANLLSDDHIAFQLRLDSDPNIIVARKT